MNAIDTAWAAGLYEGEGSASVLRSSTGRPKAQLCLASTDRDVLLRFLRVVGVGRITGPRLRKKNKPIWQWRGHGWDIVRLWLRELGPHLGERRRLRLEEVLSCEPPPRIWVAPNQKLTHAEVREVRRRLAEGESQTALGKEYGITQAQIWKIKVGRTYKNVC